MKVLQIPLELCELNLTISEIGALAILTSFSNLTWSVQKLWEADRNFQKTVDNLYKFEQMAFDPIGTAGNLLDISKDLSLVTEGSEVFFNLSNCHFETSVFDVIGTCTSKPEACSIPQITQNWSKNMFLLIGKMTSMAESLENFPNPDNEKFEEQTVVAQN